MLQDVPEFVDVTPVNQSGGAKRLGHRLVERLRAIEDDQQAPIGPQAAALQIRQKALTHGRILRRPVPEAERVFSSGVIDAEGHDDAVLTDVDPVDQQRHVLAEALGDDLFGDRRIFENVMQQRRYHRIAVGVPAALRVMPVTVAKPSTLAAVRYFGGLAPA